VGKTHRRSLFRAPATLKRREAILPRIPLMVADPAFSNPRLSASSAEKFLLRSLGGDTTFLCQSVGKLDCGVQDGAPTALPVPLVGIVYPDRERFLGVIVPPKTDKEILFYYK
jgi:hypothetical protein